MLDPKEDEQNQINIPETLREAVNIYSRYFPVMTAYGLLHGIAGILTPYLFQRFGIRWDELATFLSLLLSSFVVVALIYAASRVTKGKDVSIRKTFNRAKRRYWDFIGVHFSYILVIFGGALLFIIPGVYLATIFFFAELVTVLERKGFMDSFRRSARLVKFYFAKVLIFSLGLILILFGPLLLIESWLGGNQSLSRALNVTIQVFIVPYYMIAEILLYTRLSEIYRRASFDEPELPEETEDY